MNDKYTMKNAERLKQAEKWLEWRSVFFMPGLHADDL